MDVTARCVKFILMLSDLCAICQSWNISRHVAGSKIIVRPEEAFIVILVLILWVGAIGLFFHRWGKIRMLEPYTPKFEAELHRPSCAVGLSMDPIVVNKRMSLGPLTSLQCGSSWNPSTMGVGRGKKIQKNSCKLSPRDAFQLTFCLFSSSRRSLFTFLTAPSEFGICRSTFVLSPAASKENQIRRRHPLTAPRGGVWGLA